MLSGPDSGGTYGSPSTSADDDYSIYEHTWGSAARGKKNANSGNSADINMPHRPIGGLNENDIDRMNADEDGQKGTPIVLTGPKFPCGGPDHGACHMGKCVCNSGRTCPLCLAYVAYNDVDYDALIDAPLTIPTPQVSFSVKVLVLIGGMLRILILL